MSGDSYGIILNTEDYCAIYPNVSDDKAEIVKRAFFGPITPEVPASVLQLHNDVTLVGDEAALSLIGSCQS